MCLSCGQRRSCPLRDQPPLLLSQSRTKVQHERVCTRAEFGDSCPKSPATPHSSQTDTVIDALWKSIGPNSGRKYPLDLSRPVATTPIAAVKSPYLSRRPHSPRVPSLEAFGRRPQCQSYRRDGPSSETLHNRGSRRYERKPKGTLAFRASSCYDQRRSEPDKRRIEHQLRSHGPDRKHLRASILKPFSIADGIPWIGL